MFYNIEQTLEYLPYISFGILVVTLLFLESRNIKEQLRDRPEAESERGNFIPPHGDGYEYYVSANTIVYVLNKAKKRFRVYLIQGNQPHVRLKHDSHGTYFTVRAENTGTVEKIIDRTFKEGAAYV